MTYTTATSNDAGLLREFVATRYEQFLLHGGGLRTYSLVLRHVKRLSQLTGKDVDTLFADLTADADAEAEAEAEASS